MKQVLSLVALFFSITLSAQNLNGAWKLVNQNGKPFTDECIKIYSDSYFMFAIHKADGSFIKAGGGSYTSKGKEYTEVLDFYTTDSTQVRKPVTYSFSVK
jgi:hypothetical protein